MTRVATIPLQRTMASAISRAQEQLADTQRQLSTRKKAATFADLGTEAVRNLSAHSLLARQDAQATVSKRVGTTLSLYQANLEGIDDATSDLRTSLMKAVGTGDSAGLQEAIQTAFDQFRTSLNASEGGTPLFGGSQVDQAPFSVDTLAQAATTPGASAFHNDTVRANARVADGVDISYGVGASEIGANLYEAFRTLGQAGDIGTKPTDAQMDAIKQAVAQLNTGLGDVRAINADNGRKQNQVDTLTARGEARGLVLQGVIQDNEDADLGQVAIDLAQQKTVLEASYSVFAQLSGLNLAAYLK
ncbi:MULTISPECIES: flagellin [Sphingomonas]|uniref:Flagellar hook-associated protein 3 FlgL n=1 Tax=Sphingomonas leidyi TaxID=68569 RepID=A0A7X5V299_9SPHN|nr:MULTISPECIES: flagellin [Sphingomonas]MBN8811282.1 flagellin [Sphingomonas sp.]NIJ66588.1 flagellar hook-associated protein 3 FlgL [Sphingomonas leidyi]OJY54737.1 MAG: flagellin [Sphingomonas sp. 67-41]